jgi:hypothetical protein
VQQAGNNISPAGGNITNTSWRQKFRASLPGDGMAIDGGDDDNLNNLHLDATLTTVILGMNCYPAVSYLPALPRNLVHLCRSVRVQDGTGQ